MPQVDMPRRVLADGHDISDGFPPRQLVAVMLVGAHEHDRAFRGRDPLPQVVPLVELCGQPQPEHVHQLVDRTRRAGPREDDRVALRVRTQGLCDDVPCLLPEARRLEARARRLGVGVRIPRQDRGPDVLLEEAQAATRRRVVGIRDPARPERAVDDLVVADDGRPDALDERLPIGGCVRRDGGLARAVVDHRRILEAALRARASRCPPP
jgi:hypothetical protein